MLGVAERRTLAPALIFACLVAGLLAGCDGPQSALDPAGPEAEKLAKLFWVMTIGAVALWAGVMGLALYAVKTGSPPAHAANLLILGGGVVLSITVLTALLIYGLVLTGTLRSAGAG